jgi:CheY-like chemotaxis protein
MKKILLVHNLEAFLERNKSLLSRSGFLILTATSVKEALLVHGEQPVDLIISLLAMPETGGDTLCSLIRETPQLRNVPIILVCYDAEPELERASRCGANAWVTRPVRPELLLEQVGRFLKIPARRDYRVVFNARVVGTRGDLPFSGMTRNISASGLFCETSTLLAEDDLITNLLIPIESFQIVADGIVVRSESRPDGMYNYGVHFTNLAPESRDKIERFVSAA